MSALVRWYGSQASDWAERPGGRTDRGKCMTQSGFVGSLSFLLFLPGLGSRAALILGCCPSFIPGGAFQRARAFSKLDGVGHFLLVVVIWTRKEFCPPRCALCISHLELGGVALTFKCLDPRRSSHCCYSNSRHC